MVLYQMYSRSFCIIILNAHYVVIVFFHDCMLSTPGTPETFNLNAELQQTAIFVTIFKKKLWFQIQCGVGNERGAV